MLLPRSALACCFLLAALALPGVPAPSEKTETWTEVRSPNFRVIANGGEKRGREVALQFEQIRVVFRQALPFAAAHPSPLVTVLAAKDEKSLRDLLPEFWATKGHMHPAGIFYQGWNKYYVAVRTDLNENNDEQMNGYETIYHEYFHSLSLPYFPGLPVWLAEGLAEFYGHTRIIGKDVKLGQADANLLELLKEQRLLPLATLLRVDQSSPYYNEQSKTTIFYAESWALTHYLMIGDAAAHRPQLADYLARLDRGESPDQAAQHAFGDLAQLEKRLRDYVGHYSFFFIHMKAPEGIDEKAFVARLLSPAESAAVRGDFFILRGQLQEGKSLLDDALHLDPQNALAHEGMGFLNFRQGNAEEAARWFGQAIALDSQNYLPYYFRAMLSSTGHFVDAAVAAQDESDLRRAIVLNPSFAPAYSILAVLVARDTEKWPEALALARKAVALEPGDISVQLNLGSVLMRMNRAAEARAAAQHALAAARTPQERAEADSFLASLAQFQTRMSGNASSPEDTPGVGAPQSIASSSSPALADDKPPGDATTKQSPTAFLGPGLAEGDISAVSCIAREMNLTLDAGGESVHLHAAQFTQIEFLAEDWTAPDHFNPCRDLKGLHARIRFTPAQGQANRGEIVSIEIRPR
jgi:tetratricopeptide (TPR) repeat protein